MSLPEPDPSIPRYDDDDLILVDDCLRDNASPGGEPGRETGAEPTPDPGLRPP